MFNIVSDTHKCVKQELKTDIPPLCATTDPPVMVLSLIGVNKPCGVEDHCRAVTRGAEPEPLGASIFRQALEPALNDP